MPKVKIEKLKAGLVVCTDVKNIDNMLLVPAGSTLSDRQIQILNSWGVTEVDVTLDEDAEEVEPESKLSAQELDVLKAEVKARFWKPDENNPVYMEIFKLALQRRIQGYPKELAAA